jgi:methylated-DNA-[protein]-cysteine S-methyltransferase
LAFARPTRRDAERDASPGGAAVAVVPLDEAPPAVAGLIRRLQRFAAGRGDGDFRDVPIEISDHTEFQRRVVEQCRSIPSGSTCSYGELARRAGRPGAARAVGNVMRNNRLPLIVPCHRVVASSGKLQGFSAPQGLSMKQRLLDMEAALVAAD